MREEREDVESFRPKASFPCIKRKGWQSKIKEFGPPQLILAENTVCGAARDALEDSGVALVLNVKLKVLYD